MIAIQYVVINHGAVRISEVTARFTLDALPGKQMSIDADLNSGLIDENESRRRRKELSVEAEFYGWSVALHAARCGGQHSDYRVFGHVRCLAKGFQAS